MCGQVYVGQFLLVASNISDQVLVCSGDKRHPVATGANFCSKCGKPVKPTKSAEPTSFYDIYDNFMPTREAYSAANLNYVDLVRLRDNFHHWSSDISSDVFSNYTGANHMIAKYRTAAILVPSNYTDQVWFSTRTFESRGHVFVKNNPRLSVFDDGEVEWFKDTIPHKFIMELEGTIFRGD